MGLLNFLSEIKLPSIHVQGYTETTMHKFEESVRIYVLLVDIFEAVLMAGLLWSSWHCDCQR